MGGYKRGYEGDTRSLDYSSNYDEDPIHGLIMWVPDSLYNYGIGYLRRSSKEC